ncbi:Ankyrin repeat-containing protein (modular protein) [Burkholderia sp. 8Y]|uniref:ankyrin repeat domain-containing protein n=1 Tax=Burkholderia sp. 8Y TaxID=2653133 RepID=UPI0012F0EACD|nr:ankyrin repeat domain-containing protein [Burkholderia sp. 8Y]VXC90511.1 Ankyrin repeat-containing protein (modular protein) [Burkholderia sp. 8Y]
MLACIDSQRKRSIALFVLPFIFACGKATDRSPLALAAELGDLSKVQHQVDEGADIGAKDGKSLDALAYAIINEYAKVVEYLLIRGANANTENSSGITATIIAATVGRLAIIESLHQHGADANRATEDGVTPLMAAAASGNEETAALLLSYRADPCIRDKNRLTARQIADEWRGIDETSRVISGNRKLAELNCVGESDDKITTPGCFRRIIPHFLHPIALDFRSSARVRSFDHRVATWI